MMGKSREQFEAWASSKWDGELGSKDSDGNYHFEPVQLQWEGWQASRSAVEIELPEVTEKRWWSSWHGEFRYEAFWLEVRRVLVSHSLKVVNK